jgi:ribose 5-phosphate isomerase B
MRVYLASDHAGFDLKNVLMGRLAGQGHQTVDVGAHRYDAEDDYPGFCIEAGRRVVADPGSLGVVIGGSGNGEQIAANKVAGVRAALAWNPDTARLAREHNDANVVAIGARMHDESTAASLVELFLTTSFSGAERHARRIAGIAQYEQAPSRFVAPAD